LAQHDCSITVYFHIYHQELVVVTDTIKQREFRAGVEKQVFEEFFKGFRFLGGLVFKFYT